MRQKWPNYRIDAWELAKGQDVVAEVLNFTSTNPADRPVLVYSSATPDDITKIQAEYGRDKAGAMVEDAFGQIAVGLMSLGVSELIVAGGETSGAVVSALDIKALRIGPEIDPGVPWCESYGSNRLSLALKSGNFGGPDFFEKALGMLT